MILCSDGDQTALQSSPGSPRYRTKGAGSYLGQGGGKLCKKGILGAGGESWAAGANRGQWGPIMQKRHFVLLLLFFVNISTIKT